MHPGVIPLRIICLNNCIGFLPDHVFYSRLFQGILSIDRTAAQKNRNHYESCKSFHVNSFMMNNNPAILKHTPKNAFPVLAKYFLIRDRLGYSDENVTCWPETESICPVSANQPGVVLSFLHQYNSLKLHLL